METFELVSGVRVEVQTNEEGFDDDVYEVDVYWDAVKVWGEEDVLASSAEDAAMITVEQWTGRMMESLREWLS